MASTEKLHHTETKMPSPGTLVHLEYLRKLDIDAHRFNNSHGFLIETMAATSLARVIMRHRTYWPMRNLQTADLDTRLMKHEFERPRFFRGSIGVKSNRIDNNHLIIHSQPTDEYYYDLVIPVTDAHFYDPSRPVQASYIFHGNQRSIYNEAASLDYDEHDPNVLISAVQESADDLLRILNHIYGETQGVAAFKSLDPNLLSWHSDYLQDDPNEFMPRPSSLRNALQRVRRANPLRPDYLNDDPDEFLKAV